MLDTPESSVTVHVHRDDGTTEDYTVGREMTPVVSRSSLVPAAAPIARRFHEAYERHAPSFAWETQRESRVDWDDLPTRQKMLMIATVIDLMQDGTIPQTAPIGITIYREWCTDCGAPAGRVDGPLDVLCTACGHRGAPFVSVEQTTSMKQEDRC